MWGTQVPIAMCPVKELNNEICQKKDDEMTSYESGNLALTDQNEVSEKSIIKFLYAGRL